MKKIVNIILNNWKRIVAFIVLESMLIANSPAALLANMDTKPTHAKKEIKIKVLSTHSDVAEPTSDTVISFDNVTLEIPAGAVDIPTKITVQELSNVESLNQSMYNITAGAKGYRFLPHGIRFNTDIKITIPYNKEKVTDDSDLINLYTYFYNEKKEYWERLEKTGINEERGVVTSVSNHFTDMINSTLKLPESPKPLSFNPNSIKDIKAANPIANIQQIKGLEPNSFGSANFSLPLTIPAGRNGMQPQVSLDYNSNAANGWLGVGFDISVPSITIDTKFGLPNYDETDTYLLNGQELVAVQDTGSEIRYKSRVEGGFARIIRKGSSANSWWFEITSKDGTRQIYGTGDAVLQSYRGTNPINRWFLKRVIDTNGNMVIYNYSTDTVSNNAEPSRYTYLSGIEYTAHQSGITGKYYIEFMNEDRTDIQVDCRGKFKSALRKRLKEINVKYDNETIRRYKLIYTNNLFGKSQCIKFTEYAVEKQLGVEQEHEFYAYDFSYFEMPTLSEDDDLQKYGTGSVGDIKGFSETVAWNTGKKKSMNETHTIGGGGGCYVGVGFTGLFNTSVGGNAGFQLDYSFDKVNFMDINGDSLPDIVYYTHAGSPLYTLLNTGDGFDTTPQAVTNFYGLLNSSIQPSFSFGISASAGPVSGSVGGSFAFANALSTWTDIDGDGFVDYIPFPHSSEFLKGSNNFGEIRFDGVGWKTTTNTVNPDDIPDIGISDLEKMDKLNSGFHLLDPVRKWQPYKNGKVRITGTIDKQDNGDVSDGVKINLYKNNESIWSGISNDPYFNAVTDDAEELHRSVFLKEGIATSYDHDDIVSVIAKNNNTDDIYFKVNSIDGIKNDVVKWNPKIVYTEIQYHDKMEGIYSYNDTNYPVHSDGSGKYIQVTYTTPVGDTIYHYSTTETVGHNTDKGILVEVKENDDSTIIKKWVRVIDTDFELIILEDSIETRITANTGNGVTAYFDGHVYNIIENDNDIIKTFKLTDNLNNVPVQVDSNIYEDTIISQLLPDNINDIDFLNTFYTKSGSFYDVTEDTISSNDLTELTRIFKSTGFVFYDTLIKNLKVYESTIYPVTEIEYTQAIMDNNNNPITEDIVAAEQYENNSIDGTTSYILCEDFDAAGNTIEKRQYIHVFQPVKDFTLVDLLAGNENPATPPPPESTNIEDLQNALEESDIHTSGGVYNWSYLEWNGDIAWDENKIGTLPEDDENFLYSQAMLTMAWDYIYEDPTADLTISNTIGLDMFRGTETRYIERTMDANGQMVDDEKFFVSYISYDKMCPTRKGGNSTDDIPSGDTSEIKLGGIGNIRNSFNLNFNAGGGVGAFALNVNTGFSKCYRDFFDINGDRYPDQIIYPLGSHELYALVNKNGGGFDSVQKMVGGYADLRVIENSVLGIGITPGSVGSFMKFVQDPEGYMKQAAPDKSAFCWGASMNGSLGQSVTKIDMVDVNGDGLPDHIRKVPAGGYTVRLNLGDRFGAEEVWRNTDWTGAVLGSDIGTEFGTDISPISPNYLRYTNTISGGVTASVGIDRASVNGGVNITGNRTKVDLVDMNGDGLIDQVYKLHNNDFFYIKFNTGDGFSNPVKWYRPDWEINNDNFVIHNYVKNIIEEMVQTLFNQNGAMNDINVNDYMNFEGIDAILGKYANDISLFGAGDVVSFQGGINFQVGFNFTVEIGPMGIIPISIFITPNGNFAYGISGSQLALRDIDGDGLPDHVFKYAIDDFFRVKLNTAKKVGLLREIKTPSGGSITLDYEKTTNTVDMPNSQYVLTSVAKTDGFTDSYTVEYEYENGYYERTERQFYGFGKVSTVNPDYSYTINYFYNQDFYTKSIQYKSETYDSDDHKYVEKVNTYSSIVEDSSIYDSTMVVFPQLVETNSYYYDSVNQSEYIQTGITYSYDNYGNVVYAIDKGDVNDYDDDIHIHIQYEYNTDEYIVSNPLELKVTDASGSILRRRWGEFDDNGNLEQLEQYNADGENPVYHFEYDSFGNMIRSIDASGYFVVYEYETVVYSYISQTTDAFGYTSSAAYDYAFGVGLISTDINGNTFSTNYDIFGRVQTIFTDYDSPNYPAVEFSYYHTEFPARAVTKNKIFFNDSSRNPITYDESETLDTVIIIDGLGRVIQTKKEGEVLIDGDTTPSHGMNVSGRVVYDEMGRVWQQGQPLFQDEYDTQYYDTELLNPTITTYDVLGRTVETELPDTERSTITNEYRVENGLFKTTVTDPNGNRKVSYADIRENIIRLDQFNEGKTITTRYEYSLLNEIEKVIDAKNNETIVTYDSLGRRTSIDNPDMGLIEYGYDIASNLVWKIDNNMRARDRRINYEYTYNRLDSISYPDSPSIVYHYGEVDADYNRIGRIWKVEDESGSKEYFYGKLGQEEKVVQTLNSLTLGLDPISFETSYGYDYLGRMNWIDYPDDEILHYEYDNGGQISKVYSEHRGHTFNYIDHIYYDEFGQRKQIEYNNGVVTDYTYDETRRWLEQIETRNSKRTFQNMHYEFDSVGNVTSTLNVGTKDYNVGTITTEQVYEYDDLYQLTKAVGTNTVTSPSHEETTYQQDFQYDDIGNMIQKTSFKRVNPMNTSPNNLNYNFTYLYNQNKPHQAYKIGDWSYIYDSNGNVIRKNLGGGESQSDTHEDFDMENPNHPEQEHDSSSWLTRETSTTTTVGTTNETPYNIEEPREEEQEEIDVQFKWNEENRLMESTVSGETTKYLYDGSGERTIKKSKFGESTYVNKFFQLQNRDVITKHIFVGSTRIVSKLSHLDEFGDLVFERNNMYYYHADHLGNTTYITDKDGNEWEHFEYTPYGETWITEENRTHSFGYRFTGKELDEETNLYYFGARYLDAQTGRWLSCDPAFAKYLPTGNKENDKNLLGLGGVFNHTNLNVYHYAGNNPIIYIDPNGETILPTSIYYFNDFHQNEFLEKHDINLGNSNISVERFGCKLVSITRIANVINWEENGMAMGDAIESNSIGVDNGIFSGALLNGAAAVENLIEAITDIDVTAYNVSGTENIRTKLTELSDSDSEHAFVMGAYRVGNGSHYVNIEGIDGDNAIINNSYDGGRSSIPIADLTLITVVEVD